MSTRTRKTVTYVIAGVDENGDLSEPLFEEAGRGARARIMARVEALGTDAPEDGGAFIVERVSERFVIHSHGTPHEWAELDARDHETIHHWGDEQALRAGGWIEG